MGLSLRQRFFLPALEVIRYQAKQRDLMTTHAKESLPQEQDPGNYTAMNPKRDRINREREREKKEKLLTSAVNIKLLGGY